MDLSVVIPVFNEEQNIPMLLSRLTAVVAPLGVAYEFVFVNDGSEDRTIHLLREAAKTDAHVHYLDLSRNFGHQVAVTAGLDHCKGERVVIIDADLQDPPERIKDLMAKMDEGFDVVYAKRRTRKGESLMKKATASWFYRVLDRITVIHIPVDTGDFRIISRRVVEVLKLMPEREKFIRGQIAWMGFEQTFLEYDRAGRHAGETGYSWRKMLRFAIDGITSFSNFPLKVATISGFVVSFISFLLMLFALYSRFIGTYEPGWTSLMLSVLFIGGIQLISVGIIGEYIGRISNNVRNRPLYLIKESKVDDH